MSKWIEHVCFTHQHNAVRTGCTVGVVTFVMRIYPINNRCGASAVDRIKAPQQKPPLHTIQQHHRRNEHAINDIMEDVSTPQNTDALSGTAQQNKAEQSASGNNFVVDDDDDDFMARIVDGTCRGIFSSSGNNEDDHDRPSLCHLPSCQLGENLNVLMVCSFFLLWVLLELSYISSTFRF